MALEADSYRALEPPPGGVRTALALVSSTEGARGDLEPALSVFGYLDAGTDEQPMTRARAALVALAAMASGVVVLAGLPIWIAWGLSA